MSVKKLIRQLGGIANALLPNPSRSFMMIELQLQPLHHMRPSSLDATDDAELPILSEHQSNDGGFTTHQNQCCHSVRHRWTLTGTVEWLLTLPCRVFEFNDGTLHYWAIAH